MIVLILLLDPRDWFIVPYYTKLGKEVWAGFLMFKFLKRPRKRSLINRLQVRFTIELSD